MPWRYWLKWLLAVDTHRRLILAQQAHQGPVNDCATLRPLLDEVAAAGHAIGTVVADASLIANVTTSTSVGNSEQRASFQPNEQGQLKLTECVHKCERPFQEVLSATGACQTLFSAIKRKLSARAPAGLFLPNANKLFCLVWHIISIASRHQIFDSLPLCRTNHDLSFSKVI